LFGLTEASGVQQSSSGSREFQKVDEMMQDLIADQETQKLEQLEQ